MADLNKINFMSKNRYEGLTNIHSDEIYAVKQDIVDSLDTTSNNDNLVTSAWVKNILSEIYPIGSIYIGTQSICPMATLISDSTWELVSKGKVLQGSDSLHTANSTIEAGLPNISGNTTVGGSFYTVDGCFEKYTATFEYPPSRNTATNETNAIRFNASESNSIYGNSDTVQPPAYVVNVWRRTA